MALERRPDERPIVKGIVQHPGVASITTPFPDYPERLELIRAQLESESGGLQ